MDIQNHVRRSEPNGRTRMCREVIQELLGLAFAIVFVVPRVCSLAIELRAMTTVMSTARAQYKMLPTIC